MGTAAAGELVEEEEKEGALEEHSRYVCDFILPIK